MPLFRRRRPLVRAAAVGGAGYLAGKHAAQADEDPGPPAEQPAAVESRPAPAANGGLSSDAVDRLKELGELHEQGVLTDGEFNDQKAKLLGG